MKRYLYETHLHTREGSACGDIAAADCPMLYRALGYDGIFITDHFYGGNTAIDKTLPWRAFVDGFCAGYEMAKEAGDRIGFPVFFGWEERFELDECLIYGLDKQWLYDHPELREIPRGAYLKLVKEAGGFVVQAHPFRAYKASKDLPISMGQADAFEGYNGGGIPQNYLAVTFAAYHGIPVTSGTDRHSGAASWRCLGVETKEPILCAEDYGRIIRQGNYTPLHSDTDHVPIPLPDAPLRLLDGNGEPLSTEETEANLPPEWRN